MTHFNELGLAEPVLRAVEREGYDTPTPIQAQVIPAMLNGFDILGIAQTGTGKTAAFVLPLLHGLAVTKPKALPKSCAALIMVPTRELARQVAESVETYGGAMPLKTAIVVGGVKYGPQIKRLSRGVDILIATPGRLEDLMSSDALTLENTHHVVLDEADQMLDLGFAPAIQRILGQLPEGRQTALLTATMEKKIRRLAQDFLNKPKEISVAPTSKPIEQIEQMVVHTMTSGKRPALISLLRREEVGQTIVFTRTKFGAEKLAKTLSQEGMSADAIHGNKNQRQRDRALNGFRKGKTQILVATDVAARGIDVDNITHVVNFELPNVAEAYVHRIGRTGRAGRSGHAISFCDASERGLLRDIERLIGTSIVVGELEGAVAPSKQEIKEAVPVNKTRGNKARGNSVRRGRGADRSAGRPTGRGQERSQGRGAQSRRSSGDRQEQSNSNQHRDNNQRDNQQNGLERSNDKRQKYSNRPVKDNRSRNQQKTNNRQDFAGMEEKIDYGDKNVEKFFKGVKGIKGQTKRQAYRPEGGVEGGYHGAESDRQPRRGGDDWRKRRSARNAKKKADSFDNPRRKSKSYGANNDNYAHKADQKQLAKGKNKEAGGQHTQKRGQYDPAAGNDDFNTDSAPSKKFKSGGRNQSGKKAGSKKTNTVGRSRANQSGKGAKNNGSSAGRSGARTGGFANKGSGKPKQRLKRAAS